MARRCPQVPLIQSMLPGHGGGASYYSAAHMTRIRGLSSSKAWTILWLLFYLLLAGLLFSQGWSAPNLTEIGGGIPVDARLATWFLAGPPTRC